MGGGENSISSSPDDDEDDSHCSSDELGSGIADQTVKTVGFDDFGEFYEMGSQNSSNLAESNENLRRLGQEAYLINSYKDSSPRIESLKDAKRMLLRYTPGSRADKEDGENLSDFDAPKTTTLLLVGFKGSGKSSLVNRISRVFEDDKLASDRAQVSYCSSPGDGTYFLQAYMIPKGSSSFCLVDTRGLSDEAHDNYGMIKSWMTNGVRSGELVIRDSDSASMSASLQCKIRHSKMLAEKKVNFVIFVVDGLSVLRYMNSGKQEDALHAELLARTCNFPYLSFRDDKPAIVVTRGDLLTLEERANVRIYLGELLGVSPSAQIFDIPESCDSVTELAIVDMLRYALEHADKNLPRMSWKCRKLSPIKLTFGQVSKCYFITLILMGLALGVVMEGHLPLVHYSHRSKCPVNHPHHHRVPLVNQTIDHLAKPEFNAAATQPTSSPDHQKEHQALTRESSNQPKNVEASNSAPQSTPSQFGNDQPTKLHHPSVQTPHKQKIKSDPEMPLARPHPRSAQHMSRVPLPKKPEVNEPKKQHKADDSEPEINWKARQRLCLDEEPDANWKARQRLWLDEE